MVRGEQVAPDARWKDAYSRAKGLGQARRPRMTWARVRFGRTGMCILKSKGEHLNNRRRNVQHDLPASGCDSFCGWRDTGAVDGERYAR
jgi:hypothetical protein